MHHQDHWSRRQFLGRTALAALASAELLPHSHAQTAPKLAPLNRFPRMVQEYFVARVRALSQARTEQLYGLATQRDAEAYVQSVRHRVRQSFGPDPERTPLNAQVRQVLDRGTYRIENLIFESRPNFLVSANLYLPKESAHRPYPLPGVIGTCGHSSNGKAETAYQSFAQGLARQGYVVLLYDPIGQGERLQYPDAAFRSEIGVGVREHLYVGNQQCLVGEFFGSWRAWDGIRALDYLLTRPEVDPTQLGVTGNSGGGTMTTWLAGLDPRYTMAAPSCFVTSFRRNLENELPADTEQCPPRALALGLEHEDFLAAMAPKPVIILAKERDYFDVRGSEAALARLKHLYRLLGAEDQFALFTGPTTHGYSQENREAMYRWFNRATQRQHPSPESELVLESDDTLRCAPNGQVASLGSISVHKFTRAHAQKLKTARGKPRGDALRNAVQKVLRIPDETNIPSYRILRQRRNRHFPRPQFTTYAIETEPGIQSLCYLLTSERHQSRPPQQKQPALLYVSHLSADAELRESPFLKSLSEQNPTTPLYATDLRGSGESQPDTCGENSFLSPYGSDYFYSMHAWMLDDPYPGQKTRDLLGVVHWLRSQGHESVHVIAKGRGTIPAAFAAVMSDGIDELTLINALRSYQDIAESERYDWPLSTFVPDVLQHFDLSDLHAEFQTHHPLHFVTH